MRKDFLDTVKEKTKQGLDRLVQLLNRIWGRINQDREKPLRFERQWIPYILGGVLLLVMVIDFGVIKVQTGKGEAIAASAVLETQGDFHKDGAFTIRGLDLLDEEYIQEHLRITPEVNYTVTKDTITLASVKVRSPQATEYTVTLLEPYSNRTLRWTIPAPALTVRVSTNNVSTAGPIRLIFSEPVSKYMLTTAGFLDIDPYLRYDVRVSGNTASIYPDTAFLDGQTYKIALDSRITSENGNSLEHNYNFSVRATKPKSTTTTTPAKPKFTTSMTNNEVQVLPAGEEIALEFETKNGSGSMPMTINTYRFPSIDRYITQAEMLVNYSFDPADILEKVDTNLHLLTNGLEAVNLPSPGPGAYLIEATLTNPDTKEIMSLRKAIFITDISLYMQTVESETLVWANSTATGEPLSGYTVEFLTRDNRMFATGTTDSTGVSILRSDLTREDSEDYYSEGYSVLLRSADGEAVYVDNTRILNPYYYGGTSNRYYSFFYTDRAIYRPTDEINFWGYVQAHVNNTAPLPRVVEVELEGQDITMQVELDAYGTFHGTIALDQVKSSQYGLYAYIPNYTTDEEGETVQSGRTYLESIWLDVKDFQKPLFTISSETDKAVYEHDETVTVYVTPQFYDGTPLPNYSMEFSIFSSYYGQESDVQIIQTDDTGVAVVQFPAYQLKETKRTWQPLATRYKVKIASDGENITHYGTYTLLPTDLMLESSIYRNPSGNVNITVDTTRMSLDSVSDPDSLAASIIGKFGYYDYYDGNATATDYDQLRSGPMDLEVQVAVEYVYYDLHRSRYSEEQTLKLTTTNGTATITDLMPPDIMNTDAPQRVSLTVTATDSAGHTIYLEDYFSYYPRNSYGWDDNSMPQVAPGYSFAVSDSSGTSRIVDGYQEYLTYNRASFNDRETMHFSLLHDGEETANEGRILYTLIQDGVIDRGIITSSELQLTQSTAYAQTVNVVAAYFDGEEVHVIRDTVVDFLTESVRLDIEVTSNQTSYRPGDDVTLSIHVTEASTGTGVASNALISVVDESIFALREQYITVLSDLYGDMYFYNYYIQKYTTTTGDVPRPGGGDGGKGGDGSLDFYDMLRSNFKDTAVFLPVRTDSSGRATVSFTLPDNITSWRVTTLSIGDNLYAGNSKDHLISSLPFFVNPVVSTKYVEGDEVALLVQGHGSLLDSESAIQYTVQIQGDGVNMTQTANGSAYESRELNFGKLPMGEYTLSASAQFLGYRDTVELPVAVISSNLELVVNKELDLTKDTLDISAMRYPVTLSFYDQQHQAYYKSVSSLLTHYCMIANQRLSRFVAKRALTRYMDPDAIPQHIQEGNDSVSDMQNYDGGVGWYTDSESEPLLTAKVLLVAGDQFNTAAMARYFGGVLEGGATGMNQAASYLGLAALGEPVTDRVETLLSSGELTTEQRSYLIAALAYAGETESAMEHYESEIAPLVADDAVGRAIREITSADITRRPKRGGVLQTQLRTNSQATAAAWIAASRLGHDDADAFSLYFAQASWRIDTLFEGMIYVTNYDKEVTPVSFTYSIGDQVRTVDLGLRGQQSISLNRSEMEAFSLGTIPASVSGTAYYIGEPGEVDINPSEDIKLEKTVKEVGDGRYEIEITVTLSVDAPSGYYDISEWVPSSMRLYQVKKDNHTDDDRWYSSYTTEGQKIRFRVYRYEERVWEEQVIKLRYQAQRTYHSEAVIDSTYIIHGNSGLNSHTDRYLFEE